MQFDRSPDMSIHEIAGIIIPDSGLARAATQFVRDTESEFLFQHSTRVFVWGALAGERRGLNFDAELLYTAALFHDLGLTAGFRASHLRFEVNGANAARDFLQGYEISDADIEQVWLAIALHTTPGISPHLQPLVALTAEGVMMDLVGLGYDDFTDAQRGSVATIFPHPAGFAEDLIQTLYDGLAHRPETVHGTGLADVLADKDPHFHRRDFCSLMRHERWAAAT
jgi:hypothetical protein